MNNAIRPKKLTSNATYSQCRHVQLTYTATQKTTLM